MTLNDYLALVENQHSNKPKFMQTLATVLAPIVKTQELLRDLPIEFDLDNAKGVQLDVVGMFVGIERHAPVPIDQLLFMFDVDGHGWDQGYWPSVFETEYTTVRMGDTEYRRILKARIKANHWDGTMEQVREIVALVFNNPLSRVFVQDNSVAYPDVFFAWDDDDRGWDSDYIWAGPHDQVAADPEVSFCFAWRIPARYQLFLLYKALIPIVGAGVRPEFCIATQEDARLFSWDTDNDLMGGWDAGVWGRDVDYITTYGLIPPDATPYWMQTGNLWFYIL